MGGRGQAVATAERVVRAPADVVRAALADYERTFAPKGLARNHEWFLERLERAGTTG
jgi:hypothetical protein